LLEPRTEQRVDALQAMHLAELDERFRAARAASLASAPTAANASCDSASASPRSNVRRATQRFAAGIRLGFQVEERKTDCQPVLEVDVLHLAAAERITSIEDPASARRNRAYAWPCDVIVETLIARTHVRMPQHAAPLSATANDAPTTARPP